MRVSVLKLVGLIAGLTLIASGCSTTQSTLGTGLRPVPQSCLAECPPMPRAESFEGWGYRMLEQYTECRVARLQCLTALTGEPAGEPE